MVNLRNGFGQAFGEDGPQDGVLSPEETAASFRIFGLPEDGSPQTALQSMAIGDGAHQLQTEVGGDRQSARRELLARRAAEAALGNIPNAYHSPFVRNAAQEAARIALGLKPLDNESAEGEQ
jgi:hypothetical protein